MAVDTLKVESHVDFSKNQIINVILDPRATAPANGVEGQFYYNTTDKKIYRFDGTNWISDGLTAIESENNSILVNQENDSVSLDVNVDNATLEIASNGKVRIKDSGVDTDKLANDAVTTVKITDSAITFQKIQDIPTMTVIGRVSSGAGGASAITIINDNDLTGADSTNLATAGAIKAYVDASISSLGTIQGGFNASSETTFPGDSETVAGDYWRVTNGGVVQGITFQTGDIIMASVNNPSTTDPNDWIFFEGNRDQASTTVLGLVMLATTAEAQAGTNNTKALTPKTLQDVTATEARKGVAQIATNAQAIAGEDDSTIMTPLKVKALMDASVGGYTATIGDGTTTSFELTHGLNTKSVIAEFFYTADDQKFLVAYRANSTTTITVTFTTPPANNAIRVVVKK